MNRLQDRVFIISGGARGLGAAQARLLVEAGAKVVIGDLLVTEGEALAAELGEACAFLPLDVTSETQWSDAVALAETLGRLHGLVNNAGVYKPLPLAETDTAEFERHTRVNQLGTFLGIRAVLPAMERTGTGAIVNMSSTVALRSAPNAIAYTASKWAVRGMTKAAALELAPKNIRVNSVHPGPIDTDMLNVRTREENLRRVQQVPIRRLGTAREIAGLVLFLLSDDSVYMTGSEIAMDGGAAL
ncbi:glucose 1-dehydrogenase [Variovorax sp. J31P207]|uniref:glucose 1-dehydrogenase n=1 Tax=Variovorax sp. J31P207 TaxID=3053510 RepID=UPI0025751683|nr:glucose 1-dehydrogenase [Variovorax sp. J31P207]MDM0069990.1 glucose 1-dehydrogenase [Variovorax sp. J31P207]